MDEAQFNSLSSDLRKVASMIPLRWGCVQNNEYDNELKEKCNIFSVKSKAELEDAIKDFDNSHKDYYRRRWYILRCADCDEYLFYRNKGAIKNPDRYDKKWDIRINGKYDFDVKGTVIPKSLTDKYEEIVNAYLDGSNL